MRVSPVVRAAAILLGANTFLLSQASGPRPPDLPNLAQRATIIVDATVEAIPPNTAVAGVTPRTDAVLRVSRALKGMVTGDRFVLLQPPDPKQAMHTDERYILFLTEPRVVEIPPRQGPPQYAVVGRHNAVKIVGDKIEVNPSMPFYGTFNGKTLAEFLEALQTLITR
jgi:hypothetical protein